MEQVLRSSQKEMVLLFRWLMHGLKGGVDDSWQESCNGGNGGILESIDNLEKLGTSSLRNCQKIRGDLVSRFLEGVAIKFREGKGGGDWGVEFLRNVCKGCFFDH